MHSNLFGCARINRVHLADADVLLWVAEHVWMWFRRWQRAVSVVDSQCRRIEVVQLLLVRPAKPVLN